MVMIASARLLPLILVFFSISCLGYDRITGHPFASRSEVIAKNGMAATSQPLATQVALDILKKELEIVMKQARAIHIAAIDQRFIA